MAAPRKKFADRVPVIEKAARWVQFEGDIECARRTARLRQEGPVRHLTTQLIYELSSLKAEKGPGGYAKARMELFESLAGMLGLTGRETMNMFTPEDGPIRKAGL